MQTQVCCDQNTGNFVRLAFTFSYCSHTFAHNPIQLRFINSCGIWSHFYSNHNVAWCGDLKRSAHRVTVNVHSLITSNGYVQSLLIEKESVGFFFLFHFINTPLSAELYVHCNTSCRPAVHEYASSYSYAWMPGQESWLSKQWDWMSKTFYFSFLNSSSSRLHFLLFNSPSDSEVESWAQRGDKWEPFSSVLHFKDADVFFLVLTKSTIILWRFLAQLRPWSQPNKCCHLYLISS